MSISTECMVVNLNQGMWEGRKLDREAGRKVVTEAGAGADAATVNKLIIPKEVLAPVGTARGAIYNHYLLHTLPWKDNGDRLLSRKMYMKFIEEHEQLVTKFHDAVTHLVDVTYPEAVAKAQFRMAGLFNPNDYPLASELRGKFYCRLTIDAVTEGSDFRVKMDADTVASIQEKIEANLNERVGAVMSKVWQQLYKLVEHYAERMKADGRLYDSVRDNLIEMAEILPGLNVLNDPNLRQIGKDIRARLGGYDVKDLRHKKKGDELRAAAAAEAEEIMETMKGFMTAMGGVADADE